VSDVVVGQQVVVTRGSHVAISASDFTVPQGKITAIIGPNGSGKSTLLHAIAGLLPLVSGKLTVLNNTPVISRSQISYVLQYTTVPTGTPLTVAEAVAMARYPKLGLFGRPTKEDKKVVTSAMERLKITDLAKRHLNELSGGQRQRILLARALASNPRMLVLDEATSALDNVTQGVIVDFLDTLRLTRIVVAHRLSTIAGADRIIVLVDGHVAQMGTYEELTRIPGHFKDLAERQLA